MIPLPSTSSCSYDEISYCQICSQPSHGNHLGAISCRACAAFFRRALTGTENHKTFKCRMGNGKCLAKMRGKFLCKKCRLDRCFEAGMTPERLQNNRDLISSTHRIVPKIPQTVQGFVGRPLFILSCEPDLVTSGRTFIDFKFLIDHASNLFSNPTSKQPEYLNSMSMLDKLSFALNKTRQLDNNAMRVYNKIGKNECLIFWEYEFMTVANWLTYCDEFQQLPRSMKMQFLKSIWYMWMRLERIATAAEAVKNNEKTCAMTSEISVDIMDSDCDITWFTRYKKEQLTYFLDPVECLIIPHIVEPLNQLEPSIQEMTYMLCLLSFRHGGKHLDGDIQNLTERLIENLANDLHNYYLNDMKLENYAARLARMIKIVQLVEKDMYERIERTEIARIFNIFILDFSHPEMFYGFKK